MKYIIILFALMMPVMAIAQEGDEPKSLNIVVVDVQELMNESKAAKSIQTQGKNLRSKYQDKIKSLESELKKAEAKVIDAGKAKDQEKFIESRKDFQEDLIEGQKEIRDLNMKLDKAITTALNKLRDEIIEIVDDMTVKNNYDLVLTRADVMTVSKNIDITAEVMKRLNKSTPDIKVRD